jgi:NADH:ubiquinone oxidoreductase subunit
VQFSDRCSPAFLAMNILTLFDHLTTRPVRVYIPETSIKDNISCGWRAFEGAMLRQVGEKLASIFLRRRVVGQDAQGNIFYSRMEKGLGGEIVEKRYVKYSGGMNALNYDPASVSPEWLQWLAKTRQQPPGAPAEGEEEAGPAVFVENLHENDWLKSEQRKGSKTGRGMPTIPLER